MGRLTCELHRPGMTALHRVGLAGLYMTLDAFNRDEDAKDELQAAGLEWRLEDRRVELEFNGETPQAALSKLMESSFQLDDGFFKLPGLERGMPPTLEHKLMLYQAMTGTFLQHGKTRTTDKSAKRTRLFEIDNQTIRINDFAPITGYKHQTLAKDFLGKRNPWADHIQVSGPLYPGGAQRHTASGFTSTSLEEPPELAICLPFAVVGSVFFHISSRRIGGKARTALVLPAITSLRDYSKLRRTLAAKGVLALTAASPTDAALQLAVMTQGQELSEKLSGPIRIMAFGTVPWSKQQKSRTAAYAVNPAQLPGMANYDLASRIFKNHWQVIPAKTDRKGNVKEPEHAFVRPFTAREIIADNVANRRQWYAGFTEYMTNKETRISLQFERKELFEMTQKAEYDHPNERIFIQTCHEAWRRRLGRLGARAKEEGKSEQGRKMLFRRFAGNEYEKLRVALARCKNTETLRAVITDFWARAGSLPSLHEDWSSVLPLLDSDWRKARDLALLALASYQPSNADEDKALTETNTTTDAEGP